MDFLKLIVFSFLSFPVNAVDIYVSSGYLALADNNEGQVYSITVEHNDYKIDLSKWSDYGRTPWYPWHPEWEQYSIEKHYVLSVTKKIYSHNVTNDLNFFIDVGFAYADKLSRTSSTHLLFRENLGFNYKDFNIYWRHTSNAGIKSPNTGEDAIMLEIKVDF